MADRQRKLGFGRKVLYTAIVLLFASALVEVGLRALFSLRVGPRVFLYGTSYYRNPTGQGGPADVQAGDPEAHRKGNHSAVGNTDNPVGSKGYVKYFPNQSKMDYDEHGNRFTATINAQGFRGKNFTPEKAPGTIRVITLGASSTFGYYDRDNETYPYYLEQELNAAGAGKSFEVLNLGIPHLTSAQILELFRAEALPLNPDVVTFYEGINDASETPEETWMAKREEVTAESSARNFRKSLSNLSFVRDVYVGARERLITLALIDSVLTNDLVTYNRQDLERHIEGKSAKFLANISAVRELCRQKGIVFVVVKQQARSMSVAEVKGITYDEEVKVVQDKLNTTDSITHPEKAFLTHKVLMTDLDAWARKEGVPMVDVLALLDRDREVLLSWVHLNPRGNQMIAKALSQEILRDLQTGVRPATH